MKKTLLLVIFSITVLFSHAQLFKQPPASNNFADSLNKIVLDFKNNFNNIQGNKLPAEIDADTYLSKICLPAAVGCKIMRYHSVQDKSASWQGIMYAGDSYEDAMKMYKKIFSLVKKTKLKGIEPAGNNFEGEMESTDENVRFAVSALRLKTADKRYKNFVAEIALNNNYDGWEVQLNLYSKKPDTEGGNVQ